MTTKLVHGLKKQCIALINRILKNNKGKQFTYNGKTNNIPYESKSQIITTINYNVGKYTGEVKNGIPHGYGTMVYTDGARYEGEWKDGLRDGQGTHTYSTFTIDQGKYVGEWKDNKKNGQGTLTISSSSRSHSEYVGEWKDDLEHGQGTLTDSYLLSNYEYVGEWKNGFKNGQGTYTVTSHNGMKYSYVGGWNDDHYYGMGTLTDINNITKSGYFINGHFIGKNSESMNYPEDSYIISYEGGKYIGEVSTFL